jgi:hypothetical protein
VIKEWGATGHGSLGKTTIAGGTDFDMRAIITGNNQFELYPSLDSAASALELPEVGSGQYWIYDEVGRKYGFEIFDPRDIPVGTFRLKVVSDNAFSELIAVYEAWVKDNEISGMPQASADLFDDLEVDWGLK